MCDVYSTSTSMGHTLYLGVVLKHNLLLLVFRLHQINRRMVADRSIHVVKVQSKPQRSSE